MIETVMDSRNPANPSTSSSMGFPVFIGTPGAFDQGNRTATASASSRAAGEDPIALALEALPGVLSATQNGKQRSSVTCFDEQFPQHSHSDAREQIPRTGEEGTVIESASLSGKEEALLCKVCFGGKVTCMFKPCNHIVCCQNCAKRVSTCPTCRGKITSMELVFIA